MLWVCPACHGGFEERGAALRCTACAREYGIVAGIPDLRLDSLAWVDFDVDRNRALLIDAMVERDGLEAAIDDVFVSSRGLTREQAVHRRRQILHGVEKNKEDIDDWLAPALASEPAIEVGCGAGQTLAAAASRGQPLAAVDVSLEWLVIAKHLVRRYGGEATLAAGAAECLPLADGSIGGFISLDVLEHVSDQQVYVREIARVLRPGANFALSTPNRFTLGPEPHVGVWGVGFLPERFQKSWVKLASGRSYEHTRLLSAFGARKLFEDTGALSPSIVFPAIPKSDLALFSSGKARLAAMYNSLIRRGAVQRLAPFFGAYYRITGQRA